MRETQYTVGWKMLENDENMSWSNSHACISICRSILPRCHFNALEKRSILALECAEDSEEGSASHFALGGETLERGKSFSAKYGAK